MRIVLQRVSRAEVREGGRVIAAVGRGLLALVCVERGDDEAVLEWCARKTAELRIFADEQGRMNRDVRQAGGAVLAISQFTLAADISKGRRPSFLRAAPREAAEPLMGRFCEMLRARGLDVRTGRFGAMMEVELTNDGPVTIVVERRKE